MRSELAADSCWFPIFMSPHIQQHWPKHFILFFTETLGRECLPNWHITTDEFGGQLWPDKNIYGNDSVFNLLTIYTKLLNRKDKIKQWHFCTDILNCNLTGPWRCHRVNWWVGRPSCCLTEQERDRLIPPLNGPVFGVHRREGSWVQIGTLSNQLHLSLATCQVRK